MSLLRISKADADALTDILLRCDPPLDTRGRGWGPATIAALGRFADMADAGQVAVVLPPPEWHKVKATSFADDADIAAFRRCKATGKTDQECFAVGDNGIGKWGRSCAAGSGLAVALPPEDWQHLTTPPETRVEIRYGARIVTAVLRDTMPKRANIKNGAGIDLNPDTCRALGLTPPVSATVEWKFA